MRNNPLCPIPLACICSAVLVLSFRATAGNVVKANDTDNLNLGSSWVGGVPPALTDVAVWDNTVTTANTTLLGANLTWAGIKILDPGGLITISTGNTLTLGALGIDMSLATNSLTLANSNSLGASQTWNVASGLTLTASGGLSGSAGITKTSNGTLVLGAASTYSGGTVVNGGTLQVGNGTGLGTGGVTNADGTTLRITTTTSIINVVNVTGNVTIDLNNTGGNEALTGAWSGSGTVSFINQNNTAARVFTMGGGGSGGGTMAGFTGKALIGTNTGTFRFNDGGSSQNTGNANATFDLGTATATFFTRNRNANVSFGALFGAATTKITQGSSSSGTSTYSIGGKNVPCQFDGTISDGGSSAAVAITKVGTSTFTLTGPNTYVGATTVSAGTLQVDIAVPPGNSALVQSSTMRLCSTTVRITRRSQMPSAVLARSHFKVVEFMCSTGRTRHLELSQ